jgi:mannose-1-phosphate guanylyltransferase
MNRVYAIILAGGSGTRFWPASRRARPKQLLAIAPGAHESLIAATLRRIEPLCSRDDVLIATGAHLLEATMKALPTLPHSAFLGEPVARNTAPCIAWATSVIHRRDPDALVMVLPSDHHIGDEARFRAALERALASAQAGVITTIGIAPSRPETGYGYIEAAADEIAEGLRRVVRFVEKPDRARAREYVESGRHFWNSGMFFFRADAMLAAIANHLPALSEGLARIEQAAAHGPEQERAETARVFEATEPVSIDYGIMERADALNVVPASFGWSDLGSWESAWELSERDAANNAADAGAVLIDSSGNLVRDFGAAGRTIALVGVRDMCVVLTDDALLVIPRERAQDVRRVVEELERRGQAQRL